MLTFSQSTNFCLLFCNIIQGRGGVSVIRLSGKSAVNALQLLAGEKIPAPRKAVLRDIKHPTSREVLDKGLVLYFPGPNSFTGEDCVEFHVHGRYI